MGRVVGPYYTSTGPPVSINSSVIKTTSLLHIADTFPYKLLSDIPATLFHPGPLIPVAWGRLLATHPDRLYAHTITQIILHGARIGYTGPNQLIFSPNLSSANDSIETLDKDLEEQRTHHRLMPVPTPGKRFISLLVPAGFVPKTGSDGQINAWRRIHHLSFPPGRSVNDHIPPSWGALEYSSFDEAVTMVAAAGHGAILIKRDLADAFRHIPVAPEDYWLLSFSWDNEYWTDCFLPFGLRTSPFLFDLFAKRLHFMIEAAPAIRQSFSVIHCLGDFAAGRPGINPNIYESRFSNICSALGIRIEGSKSITGTTTDFNGIEFDSLAMEARLPPQ